MNGWTVGKNSKQLPSLLLYMEFHRYGISIHMKNDYLVDMELVPGGPKSA
jgi:hypothetical protein